ncbi:hypothetical protein [Streptomyces sp. NPDC005731]|uniref:hypothetical protein n=1 Tax=Streptomyces sp. NPDC005731 TaxID=3157056 RepID=UPI0033DF3EEC
MTKRPTQRKQRSCRDLKAVMRRALLAPVGLALLLAAAGCDRGTSPKTVRKLAGSENAVHARRQAESEMRSIIAAWNEHTPLTLGLVTLYDGCGGGKAKEWFFASGDDQYKIRCSMYVTAYFGADPNHIADTIDGILTAGDANPAKIPFNHDFYYATQVAKYYRGEVGDPQGPGTGEPAQLFEATMPTLNWDQVRTNGQGRRLIEEPNPCPEASNDPPVRRCLHEPASTSVSELRRRYGMAFSLTFPVRDYFVVMK